MKKSHKIAEPTLHDVIQIVQESSGRVEKRLDKVQRRLDGVERRLGSVETRMSGVEMRMGELEDTNTHVVRRIGEMEEKLDLAQEELESINIAIENDARRYFDHDQRLKRLEKARV
jgi:chromosome segregation ATPase